jgi:hypothetical protein
MAQFTAEYTDTFGGEANYSWVIRKEFNMPDNATERSIVIKAKKELGLTGLICDREDLGGMIKLKPRGSCTVVFIS